MRPSSVSLAKYVPLIKFVGGPHIPKHVPVGVHPCAPNNVMPGSAASAPSSGASSFASAAAGASKIGAVPFESRAQLSQRFRYQPIEELEIEEVNTGGAEYVF